MTGSVLIPLIQLRPVAVDRIHEGGKSGRLLTIQKKDCGLFRDALTVDHSFYRPVEGCVLLVTGVSCSKEIDDQGMKLIYVGRCELYAEKIFERSDVIGMVTLPLYHSLSEIGYLGFNNLLMSLWKVSKRISR